MSSRPAPVKQRLPDGRAVRAEALSDEGGGRWRWRVRRCEAPREAITEAVLGVETSGTRAEVERALVRYATATQAPPQGADARLRTVADLCRYYARQSDKWAAQGDLARSTAKQRHQTYARVKEARGGECVVHTLRRGDLENLRDSLRRRYRASTVCTDLANIAGAWTWARGHGLVPDRDLPAAELPEKTDGRPRRTPTLGELAAVGATFDLEWHRRAHLLLCATGCRIGEILGSADSDHEGILVERIDRARRRIEVDGKTGRRVVPLRHDPEAWAALLEQVGARAEGPIWPGDGPAGAYQQALFHACARAGVAHFTANAIRRRVSFQLLGASMHPAVYEAWMGHSYQMALRVYQTEEAVQPELDDAADKVDLKRPAGRVLTLQRRRGS